MLSDGKIAEVLKYYSIKITKDDGSELFGFDTDPDGKNIAEYLKHEGIIKDGAYHAKRIGWCEVTAP